jgi:hypothetical protein
LQQWPPKARVLFDLNIRVKMMEANEEDKLTVKQTVAKFNTGKIQSIWHITSQATSG